jgi:hypothetical protein
MEAINSPKTLLIFYQSVQHHIFKCYDVLLQVRYSQLHKAQEKLIGDLENCVSRRDTIVDQAETRERKARKGSHNTHHSFQKKLEDIRYKVKQVNSVGTLTGYICDF